MGCRLIVLAAMGVSLSTVTCAAGADAVSVRVKNPLPASRTAATVSLRLGELQKVAPMLDAAKTVIVDASGHAVTSQLVDMDGDESPDEIVWQADFGAGESKAFTVQAGQRAAVARSDFKVYGRFVRERHDDFAWENDRIAHRMYGTGLETWAKEPLTSSGIDVWAKRTSKLVINDWYLVDDYHRDNGDGGDFYSVGKSRGCGGLGVWKDDKLYVSRNFVSSRVLANGPIRLVFELTYAPWDAGGAQVAETKRVILDAGQSFDRYQSVFQVGGGASAQPLDVGIGIAKHKGSTAQFDKAGGWLRTWEPLAEPNGNLGCAIVVPGAAEYRATETDGLVVARLAARMPLVYYAGFGWDKSGVVRDADGWTQKVAAFAREVAMPLEVALSPAAPKAATSPPSTSTQDEKGAWFVRACDAIMSSQPARFGDRWDYDMGLVLLGFEQAWRKSGDPRYLDYVKRTIDSLVHADGSIEGYERTKYNIDHVNPGKVLFTLLAESKSNEDKERYRKVLGTLRTQMLLQPRTTEGGFWHKGIYPHQMWLDGVYMASPFLARYAAFFGEPDLFDDVARQILLTEKHMRDARTGLLYHGWDESREQRWSDPKSGTSAAFWGRSMGWYAMALVDVLELLPQDHPQRAPIVAVLQRLARAVADVQDAATGVWWQVLDAGGRDKNFREASSSSMFVYALLKGVKNGWLDAATYAPAAERGYEGILRQFVSFDAAGRFEVKSTCKAAGLGGDPYRDGSYAYYTSIGVMDNEPKGVGAFLLASVEHG
jgi:unsaturated rhamnogalacturonyl hydrolase